MINTDKEGRRDKSITIYDLRLVIEGGNDFSVCAISVPAVAVPPNILASEYCVTGYS